VSSLGWRGSGRCRRIGDASVGNLAHPFRVHQTPTLPPERGPGLSLALANGMVLLGSIYLIVGLVFAIYFVARGASRLDPVAAQGTWGFRLLILPGAAAMWPILLLRLFRGRTGT